MAGRLSASGFEVSTRDLAFASSHISAHDLAWPGGNMAMQYIYPQGSSPARGRLQADHLDLQALREVALHLPLPEMLATTLAQHEISGELAALQMRWQGDWQAPSTYSAQASLNQLHLPPLRQRAQSRNLEMRAPSWAQPQRLLRAKLSSARKLVESSFSARDRSCTMWPLRHSVGGEAT